MSARRKPNFDLPEHGIHQALFRIARECAEASWSEKDCLETMLERCVNDDTRRPIPEQEITAAVKDAYRKEPTTGGPAENGEEGIPDYHADLGWPTTMETPKGDLDPHLVQAFVGVVDDDAVDKLQGASPVQDPDQLAPGEVLETLSGNGDQYCVGTSISKFRRCPPKESAKQDRLVVPNPLRENKGRSKNGRLSWHCRDSTGMRRFVVVEFDGLDKAVQAAVLLKLGEDVPLAMVIDSGGKSLHGWFFVEGEPEKELWIWFSAAVNLGADPRLWLPEQFARLPNGTREKTGHQQRVLYLDPSVCDSEPEARK